MAPGRQGRRKGRAQRILIFRSRISGFPNPVRGDRRPVSAWSARFHCQSSCCCPSRQQRYRLFPRGVFDSGSNGRATTPIVVTSLDSRDELGFSPPPGAAVRVYLRARLPQVAAQAICQDMKPTSRLAKRLRLGKTVSSSASPRPNHRERVAAYSSVEVVGMNRPVGDEPPSVSSGPPSARVG